MLKSFNAEPEQAAMHKPNWSTGGALTNRSIYQPAFAACGGDGICGSQTSLLTLLGCGFLRSGTRQEFRQLPKVVATSATLETLRSYKFTAYAGYE